MCLDDPEIDDFLSCLRELLTKRNEKVKLTSDQLDEFPRWLQEVRFKIMDVKGYRKDQEETRQKEEQRQARLLAKELEEMNLREKQQPHSSRDFERNSWDENREEERGSVHSQQDETEQSHRSREWSPEREHHEQDRHQEHEYRHQEQHHLRDDHSERGHSSREFRPEEHRPIQWPEDEDYRPGHWEQEPRHEHRNGQYNRQDHDYHREREDYYEQPRFGEGPSQRQDPREQRHYQEQNLQYERRQDDHHRGGHRREEPREFRPEEHRSRRWGHDHRRQGNHQGHRRQNPGRQEHHQQDPPQQPQYRVRSPPRGPGQIVLNSPYVRFQDFKEENNTYFQIHKKTLPQLMLQEESLNYPLAVTYDERMKVWIIADKADQKLVLLDTQDMYSIVFELGRTPTALIMHEEGNFVAVLCEEERNMYSIYKCYHAARNGVDGHMESLISYRDARNDITKELRGLAKSVAGNFLCLEGTNLRLFHVQYGGQRFRIAGAKNPSFLATCRPIVAISDLGVNKVFIYFLDDTTWDNVQFIHLKVIETESQGPVRDFVDQNGFRFVAGMQFDADCYLMIGDAKGHTIKLYDPDFNFVYRISSGFVLPYISSFHFNREGECLLLDIKDHNVKVVWGNLTSSRDQLPWVEPEYMKGRRLAQKPRRGGYQKRNY